MDKKAIKKKLQQRLLPVIAKMQPALNVVQNVAQLAVQVKKPTVTSTLGLISVGLNTAFAHLSQNEGPVIGFQILADSSTIIDAVRKAGAQVTMQKRPDNSEHAVCQLHSTLFNIYDNGIVHVYTEEYEEFREWLRQAMSHVLPAHLEVRRVKNGDSVKFEPNAITLTKHTHPQAREILDSTLPLLEGGRCILLDGKPGVGKTTLAQIIARESELGRALILDPGVLGVSQEASPMSAMMGGPSGSSIRDSLSMLHPAVIIVDDIDKIRMSLGVLEALRATAKLVVLTANNGSYDAVLDGAMIRAGRVDEVFSIEPVPMPREVPFDRLDDETWLEVKEWPIAYLTEVKKRLQHRPENLRLDDLRSRLTRRTRSTAGLFGGAGIVVDEE